VPRCYDVGQVGGGGDRVEDPQRGSGAHTRSGAFTEEEEPMCSGRPVDERGKMHLLDLVTDGRKHLLLVSRVEKVLAGLLCHNPWPPVTYTGT
jgi:hypothetical protein